MIVIAAALVGIALGATTALRRGGRWPDALQYAAGYGIAFTLMGLVATIVLERTLLG